MNLFNHHLISPKLNLPDRDFYLHENVPLPYSTQTILNTLIAEMPWREESIKVWGKTYMQPRLMAWVADKGKNYTYSGKQNSPLPWTPLLLEIKTAVEQVCDTHFNSVLLNYYRHERDSMGFHSDNEAELGAQPTIASLSLGETRTFVLRHKHNKAIKNIRLKLNDGDLLVMQGNTQTNWQHGISKETKPCGTRLNLTFRTII